MKGMIFTEFLDMVEDRFGLEVADRIIEASNSASGGAYTAVGTYDHQEMVRMVGALANETGTPASDLIRALGEHLFNYFVRNYPQLFAGLHSTFEFMANLDGYIHVEVRKLYADAELPRFEITGGDAARSMELTYRSSRAFADLAEGLMVGCAAHFGEKLAIRREDLSGGQGTVVRITLEMIG
jgi:Haem-NO-binding